MTRPLRSTRITGHQRYYGTVRPWSLASLLGGEPPRGELARQLRRIEAKEEANTRRYRNRQYNTPEEIGDALERLRGYRRYQLYHLG